MNGVSGSHDRSSGPDHGHLGRRDPRKNGRGGSPRRPTFADVVKFIVADVEGCPVFAAPSVLAPIPRSGSSRESFEPGACTWPTKELAGALAASSGHRARQLLERRTPVHRSSDGPGRVSVEEHLASLVAHVESELLGARLVLLDDLLVMGTQAVAGVVALRRAGYVGPIEAYFVHQAIAPNPKPSQRLPFLTHRITWQEGHWLARRTEVGRWRTGPSVAG